MEHQHFILVHNAFHGAWIWYKLKPLLESAGHRVTAMDLAASGIDPLPIESVKSFAEYSKPLLDVMESIPEGEKVIMVGLSLGGMNIALAAEKYAQKIGVAVFVNALMPDTDNKPSAVVDKLVEGVHDWKDCKISTNGIGDEKMTIAKMGPRFIDTVLYSHSSLQDRELAKMLTKAGSFFQEDLAKYEKFSKEGYGSVARVYIMGDEDQAATKDFMQWQIDNFPVDKVYTIDGGDHMMIQSKPQELLDCLLEIAANYA